MNSVLVVLVRSTNIAVLILSFMSKNKIYPASQSITINCDASYSPLLMKGGWACWISFPEGKIRASGVFKTTISDANEAEIKSLCNALEIIERKFKERDLKLLFINCDNQTTRHIVKTRKIREKFEVESKLLLKYLERYELVITKTIKGHQRGDSPRQFVNNWCDQNSRNYLKQQ